MPVLLTLTQTIQGNLSGAPKSIIGEALPTESFLLLVLLRMRRIGLQTLHQYVTVRRHLLGMSPFGAVTRKRPKVHGQKLPISETIAGSSDRLRYRLRIGNDPKGLRYLSKTYTAYTIRYGSVYGAISKSFQANRAGK